MTNDRYKRMRARRNLSLPEAARQVIQATVRYGHSGTLLSELGCLDEPLLRECVEQAFPKIAESIKGLTTEPNSGMVLALHQDTFGGDRQLEELILFGMVVKYAGLFGVDVLIHGKNGETFSDTDQEALTRQNELTKKRIFPAVPIEIVNLTENGPTS